MESGSPNSLSLTSTTSPVAGTPGSWWADLGATLFTRTTLGLLDQAVVSGTRFFVSILIGRICGPEELGLYALGFSTIVMIVSVKYSLISLPFTVYANGLSGTQRRQYAGSTLVHLGVLCGLATIAFLLTWLLFSSGLVATLQELAPMMAALAGVAPLLLLWEFSRRFAFARLRIGSALRVDACVTLVLLFLLPVIHAMGWLSAVSAFVVVGLASGGVALAWLVRARGDFLIVNAVVMTDWIRNWFFGRWVFAGQMSWSLMSGVTPWFLTLYFGDPSQAGNYAACMTLPLLTNPLVLGVGNVLLPSMASAYADHGRRQVFRLACLASTLLGGVMVFFSLFVALWGEDVVRLMYGDAYAGAGLPTLILILATLAQSIAVGPDIGTQVFQRPDLNFRTNLIGLLVTVSTTPFLIARWSIAGAAFGWFLGNTAILGVRWVYFLRLCRAEPSTEEGHA